MTKEELCKRISKQTGYSQKKVRVIVESLMETIVESMHNGNNIYLRGFGCFMIKRRQAMTIINILERSGLVVLPEQDIPAFKPYPEFISKIK